MGIKHKVNEQFFDTWNKEMAYVLGYIFADGHVTYIPSMRGKYTCVTSTDLESIENIRDLLSSEHRVISIDKGGNYKTAYQLRVGNSVIFDRLATYGVTPHKSLTIAFPNVPDELKHVFIRGYFDGDGCASIERNKEGRARRLQTIFTSGSKQFLLELQRILSKDAQIHTSRLVKHASSLNAYQLRCSTRDSLKLFLYLYEPKCDPRLHLARKYAIFTEYLAIRDLTYKDIPYILTKLGPVVKQKHD